MAWDVKRKHVGRWLWNLQKLLPRINIDMCIRTTHNTYVHVCIDRPQSCGMMASSSSVHAPIWCEGRGLFRSLGC